MRQVLLLSCPTNQTLRAYATYPRLQAKELHGQDVDPGTRVPEICSLPSSDR